MANDSDKINAVPTNIITGYLGAGKISTILHLLETKLTNERWAVLVNEFGEIGVDGSIVKSKVFLSARFPVVASSAQQIYLCKLH